MTTSSQFDMLMGMKKKGIIKSYDVLQVMNLIDRKNFIQSSHPYDDKPQSIGYNANLSAPHLHVLVLEYLKDYLRRGKMVLDVGCGTGYLTACMATMVGKEGITVGIDHIKELVQTANGNITKIMPTALKVGQIFLVHGDGRNGYSNMAPYDVIHVGAVVPEMPLDLIKQLRPGGRMFVPVGLDHTNQTYKIVDKLENGSVKVHDLKPCCIIYDNLTDAQVQWHKSIRAPLKPEPLVNESPKVQKPHVKERIPHEKLPQQMKEEKVQQVPIKKVTTVSVNGYNYDIAKCLGEGGFGKVYKGVSSKDQKPIAVKVMDNVEEWQASEWKIPEMVRNLHLVLMIDHFTVGRTTYIVTELLDCDLRQLLKEVKGKFSLPNLKIVAMQLSKGYMALYSSDIIHRDIKPENVLVEKTKDGIRLKFADFGCGKLLDHVQYAQTYIGTKCYMAWEVFNTRHYDARADVWSLGLVLYECYFGQHFLQSPHLSHIQDIKILSGNNTFDDMLLKMLKLDYHERMGPMDFFSHTFHSAVPHGALIELNKV